MKRNRDMLKANEVLQCWRPVLDSTDGVRMFMFIVAESTNSIVLFHACYTPFTLVPAFSCFTVVTVV